jgi:hypothetical protein
MGSGGGLRDQLADLAGTGHRVGPPLSMDRRTFGPNQNVIKTGQTEGLVRRDKPAWRRE